MLTVDHRELFDAQVGWYGDYCDRHADWPPGEAVSFTEWLTKSDDGQVLLAKIDALDAPPPFEPPADRDMLAEELDAVRAGLTLYAAHTENLIERVYALEQLPPVGSPAPPVDACPNVFMGGADVVQVYTSAGWVNIHAGPPPQGTVSHPGSRFDDDPGWPHRSPDQPQQKDR